MIPYHFPQTLYLVRGLPGSGKTTFVQTYRMLSEHATRSDRVKHFEADMYFLDESGNYNFDPKHLGTAHLWCRNNTWEALEANFDVMVSNTFSTNKEMKPYFEMVDTINLHRFETGNSDFVLINVIHLENSFGSIHNVPAETIDRMKARWEPLTLKQILDF